MKDKLLLIIISVSIISMVLGIISKMTGNKILIQGYTWMNFSQTILLLAIAIGIAKLIDINKK